MTILKKVNGFQDKKKSVNMSFVAKIFLVINTCSKNDEISQKNRNTWIGIKTIWEISGLPVALTGAIEPTVLSKLPNKWPSLFIDFLVSYLGWDHEFKI